MKCTVYAVVIPPLQRGSAYAHTQTGKCIAFTGERTKMIALCDEVRLYNNGDRARVVVDTNDWEEAAYLAETACLADPGLVA